MIFVPESIERILERIEEIYKRDVKENKAYNSSILKNGKTYRKTNTTKIQLEDFRKFRESLENETSEFLVCKKGEEDKAKIRLMHQIWKYYEPLNAEDIYQIEHDVYIQKDLRERIEELSEKYKTEKEALNLLNFIDNGYYASWGQGDAQSKIRDFRLVESEEEFERILRKFKTAEDLTDQKDTIVEYTTIRVALVAIDYRTIFRKKGIYEEYERFFNEHIGDSDFDIAFQMFKLWHDVRETSIYYIYAPK